MIVGKEDISRIGRLEQVLGTLLRGGVVAAAVIVATGGLLFLLHHGADHPHLAVFMSQVQEFRSVGGIVRAALSFDALAVIQFGLLLLIATPIARVVFSLAGFLIQRDWIYTAITALVLALLLFGLLGGGH